MRLAAVIATIVALAVAGYGLGRRSRPRSQRPEVVVHRPSARPAGAGAGYREGFRKGRTAVYSRAFSDAYTRAYQQAFTDAGLVAPRHVDVPTG
jgi:hypothetical protein